MHYNFNVTHKNRIKFSKIFWYLQYNYKLINKIKKNKNIAHIQNFTLSIYIINKKISFY